MQDKLYVRVLTMLQLRHVLEVWQRVGRARVEWTPAPGSGGSTERLEPAGTEREREREIGKTQDHFRRNQDTMLIVVAANPG